MKMGIQVKDDFLVITWDSFSTPILSAYVPILSYSPKMKSYQALLLTCAIAVANGHSPEASSSSSVNGISPL